MTCLLLCMNVLTITFYAKLGAPFTIASNLLKRRNTFTACWIMHTKDDYWNFQNLHMQMCIYWRLQRLYSLFNVPISQKARFFRYAAVLLLILVFFASSFGFSILYQLFSFSNQSKKYASFLKKIVIC